MKQLREKTWAKCGATATLLLSCLLLLASCIGILFLSAFQGYDDATGEIAQEKIAERKNRPWLGRGCDDEGIGACAESSCRTRCGAFVERGRVGPCRCVVFAWRRCPLEFRIG